MRRRFSRRSYSELGPFSHVVCRCRRLRRTLGRCWLKLSIIRLVLPLTMRSNWEVCNWPILPAMDFEATSLLIRCFPRLSYSDYSNLLFQLSCHPSTNLSHRTGSFHQTAMYSKLSSNLLIVSLMMPLLATFAVALRIRARSIKKQALGADDFTIFSALVTINDLNIFEEYF